MKKVFSFTLDEGLIKELDKFCKDGLITKSKLVNKIIQDYIKKKEKKDKDEKSM
jgi:metal-responsive CopG/Arc/MetJ family transcriptional regulator